MVAGECQPVLGGEFGMHPASLRAGRGRDGLLADPLLESKLSEPCGSVVAAAVDDFLGSQIAAVKKYLRQLIQRARLPARLNVLRTHADLAHCLRLEHGG